MKLHMMVIVGVLAAGCAGKKADATMKETAPAASAGVPCAQEVALQCGDGMIDGCLAQTTTVHACVASDAKAGPPCTQEIAQVCPDGQIDACMKSPAPAANHVCVVK